VRYLVTGGAGFIGSNTVDELVRRRHSVVVLDDLSSGKLENLGSVQGKIEFLRRSIADLDALHRACRGVDYVLHMAAKTSVPQSMMDPIETNRVNVDGTLNVLVAARDAKVRRVVFAGSSAVYGEIPAVPKHENMAPVPISPYGASKFVAEVYGQSFQRAYGLEFVSLRYFNVFGPRQDPGSPYSGVLSLFNAAVLHGTRPTVYGDGEQSRDFTYVGNVVEANLLACQAQRAAGLAINIGSGNRYTLNQTLESLGNITGLPATPNYEPPREGDIRDSQADVTLARNALGYEAQIGFEEGLKLTWDWFRASQRCAEVSTSCETPCQRHLKSKTRFSSDSDGLMEATR
jgi:nucleoside-diphosphate-sugar epimerase